jgi:hypothetical protein
MWMDRGVVSDHSLGSEQLAMITQHDDQVFFEPSQLFIVPPLH